MNKFIFRILPLFFGLIVSIISVAFRGSFETYIAIRDGILIAVVSEVLFLVIEQRIFMTEKYISVSQTHKKLWDSFSNTPAGIDSISKVILSGLEGDLCKDIHEIIDARNYIVVNNSTISLQFSQKIIFSDMLLYFYCAYETYASVMKLVDAFAASSKICDAEMLIELSDSTVYPRGQTHGNVEKVKYYLSDTPSSSFILISGINSNDQRENLALFNIKSSDISTFTTNPAEIDTAKDLFRDRYDNHGKATPEVSLFESEGIRSLYDKDREVELYPDLYIDKIKTMLDIGVGVGRSLKYFLDKKPPIQIYAMDKDADALANCRKNYSKEVNIRYIEQEFTGNDSDEFPLKNGSVDLIIAYNSIYHNLYSDFMAILNRIYRLLSSDGYLVLTLKTLRGNEDVFANATNIEKEKNKFHTYVGCKYPDALVPHHFCTDGEIDEICKMFGEIMKKEPIELITRANEIVQGAGYTLVLKKTLRR